MSTKIETCYKCKSTDLECTTKETDNKYILNEELKCRKCKSINSQKIKEPLVDKAENSIGKAISRILFFIIPLYIEFANKNRIELLRIIYSIERENLKLKAENFRFRRALKKELAFRLNNYLLSITQIQKKYEDQFVYKKGKGLSYLAEKKVNIHFYNKIKAETGYEKSYNFLNNIRNSFAHFKNEKSRDGIERIEFVITLNPSNKKQNIEILVDKKNLSNEIRNHNKILFIFITRMKKELIMKFTKEINHYEELLKKIDNYRKNLKSTGMTLTEKDIVGNITSTESI